MAVEEIAVPIAKTSSNFLLPFGKISLYLTLFFLFVLIVSSIFQSVQSNSLFPLFSSATKILGADQGLYDLVTFHSVAPSYYSFFSKNFFSYIWFEISYYLQILGFLWFLFIFGWLLFKAFSSLNNTSPFIAVLLTIIFFIFLQLILSIVLFNMNLSYYYPHQNIGNSTLILLPSNNIDVFNNVFSSTYPFHGVVALFNRFADKNFFYKINSFSESDFGSLISNIPSNSSLVK